MAIAFAKEGADILIVYLNEHEDARQTKDEVEATGRQCLSLAGDVGDEQVCRWVVDQAIGEFGRVDVVVNNAAEQHPQKSITDISRQQLERTFQSNSIPCFS